MDVWEAAGATSSTGPKEPRTDGRHLGESFRGGATRGTRVEGSCVIVARPEKARLLFLVKSFKRDEGWVEGTLLSPSLDWVSKWRKDMYERRLLERTAEGASVI